MKSTVAVFGVCVVCLIMGLGQACTLNELAPCLNAVTKGDAPTKPCCAKVAAVDVGCFCALVEDGNYDKKWVDNAVGVPKACGGAAYDHFKGQDCAGRHID